MIERWDSGATIGLSSAEFDMDDFGTGVTFQLWHVAGDGTHETVSGHQGDNWANAPTFMLEVSNWGNWSFNTEQSGFDDPLGSVHPSSDRTVPPQN